MKGEYEVVRPTGNTNRGRNNGIEQLEIALSKGIATHMGTLYYDEICRTNAIGAITSKVRPVRTSNGRVDVLSTFMKVRKPIAVVHYQD